MISETQMDELADKLGGQDLELGIKTMIITIEMAMRQCHSQIDILQRFIAIVQHRENETKHRENEMLRQENAALRKRVWKRRSIRRLFISSGPSPVPAGRSVGRPKRQT
jgi:hypothetical protein